jgi:GT2 family glycosyltransferase
MIVDLIDSIRVGEWKDFELIVVDQSEDDRTADAMVAYTDDARIRYIRSAEPGCSKARNLGVRAARHDLIAITDDDCTVPPTWLESLLRPLRTEPKVGVTFCTVLPVSREGEHGHTPHIIFDRQRTLTSSGQAWRRTWRHHFWLGAGMAFRREAFDAVGGFDDMLGPGAKFGAAEDNDFAWRCLGKGWWLQENPDATVDHDGFRNVDEFRALVLRDHYGVGGAYAKHLKSGRLGVIHGIASGVIRNGLVGPLRDVFAGRRPRGFRRPFIMIRGLGAGLRIPVDRSAICYRPRG